MPFGLEHVGATREIKQGDPLPSGRAPHGLRPPAAAPLRGLRSKVDGKCLIGRWYENGVRIGYPRRFAPVVALFAALGHAIAAFWQAVTVVIRVALTGAAEVPAATKRFWALLTSR